MLVAELSDDHECVDYAEALTRLTTGHGSLDREGSTERNLELILKGMVAMDFIPPRISCFALTINIR